MTGPSLLTLPEDPKEARKLFQSLSLQNQLELVLRSRGKERLHTLFLSEHPEELVQSLPEQEIFLTVKEIGEKDCLDLISLTTPEQFQYLLDLEFWKRDQIDPEKVLHWIETLLESGDKKVAQFIRTTDPEFVALILKKFIRVTTLEGEQTEQMDSLPLFTLDQFYFIGFKGVKTREVFEPFLKTFSRIDSEGYRRLMEALISELESELEETGYRFRNSRLNDYGFPDFEEALDIYQFIQPESLLKREDAFKPIGPEPLRRESSIYYLTFHNEGPFFSAILSRIDDPQEQDRLKQEITSLCNKAIIAEAIDLSNLSGTERVIQKAYHYLNLGLQYLSSEEEKKGVDILLSLPNQKIFQCGVSLTLLLRKRASAILSHSWLGKEPEHLVLLDTPYFDKMEGVLRKRPAFYRDGVYDDFKDLRDLKAMESFLDSIEALLSFFGERLKISFPFLKGMDLSGCHPERWQEITLSTIFLTALANQVLLGTCKFEPIEKVRLQNLFSHLFERDVQGKGMIKAEMRNELREGLGSMESDPHQRDHLVEFQEFCLSLFEEAFGKIPPGEEIDPRFIKGLLIRS
ncbi:MAG: hypothetical protein FJ106_15320 [Deltaproteobacteria bacterium]|nr:hypothetical protein [Deltaproteobacteria bacterium]